MSLEKIIIVAHGSPKEEANKLKEFAKTFAITLKMRPDQVKYAYLKFSNPSLEEVLLECVKEKAKTIIVHPLFLFSGGHVISEIPEIIAKFKKNYPDIEINVTKPLGLHEKLIEIIKERIEELKQCLL
ncbi:MAG: sirohydrochlorin chelatase [Thermodesulfovibrio sp.]|jgi:precorrin-8X/cobalt-precorrin-8 methylmutase|uniref:CbiX/SirB N-terminal domain-containing protein n=1 Tax=Thermodesulfovibrio obliviosus TaxID=3118332 RepID=A0AAU8GZ06_9BACT